MIEEYPYTPEELEQINEQVEIDAEQWRDELFKIKQMKRKQGVLY